MKHFIETEMEIVKVKSKKLDYVTCDKCGKTYKAGQLGEPYVCVHTWHNRWGNDSIESHKRTTLCRPCAAEFVSNYVLNGEKTEELELKVECATMGDNDDEYEE